MQDPIPAHVILGALPPDSRGIPASVIAAISQSLIEARNRRLAEDREDPIHRWGTVASTKGPIPPEIAEKIGQLTMDSSTAEQWAYARKVATPIRKNRWIRDWWILHNWLKFQDEGIFPNEVEIGLCDLTDELASEIIENRFPDLGFAKESFTAFRKKYQLKQVPIRQKLAGTVLQKRKGIVISIERFARGRSR